MFHGKNVLLQSILKQLNMKHLITLLILLGATRIQQASAKLRNVFVKESVN